MRGCSLDAAWNAVPFIIAGEFPALVNRQIVHGQSIGSLPTDLESEWEMVALAFDRMTETSWPWKRATREVRPDLRSDRKQSES